MNDMVDISALQGARPAEARGDDPAQWAPPAAPLAMPPQALTRARPEPAMSAALRALLRRLRRSGGQTA